MKLLNLILVAMTLTACGTYTKSKDQVIDQAFQDIVSDFQKETKAAIPSNMDVRYADRALDAAGVYTANLADFPEFQAIEINRKAFEGMAFYRQKALIFRLLAQGILHKQDKPVQLDIDTGCPLTFMTVEFTSAWCLERYWDNYVTDMLGE